MQHKKMIQFDLQLLSLKWFICTKESSLVINVSPTIEIRVGLTKCACFQTRRPSTKWQMTWVLKQVIQHESAEVVLHLRFLGNERKQNITKNYDKFRFGICTFILVKFRQWH